MPDRRRDLLVGAVLLVVVIAALSLGHGEPLRLTVFFAAVASATLLVWRRRQDVVLGLVGVAIGPLTELAATSSGLWTYRTVSIAGLPLWVVPMWWIYTVTVARLVRAVASDEPRPRSAGLAVALIAIEVPWLCAFGNTRPVVALLGTLILLAVFLQRRRPQAVDLVTLLICGAIGPAAELIPVSVGAWGYGDPVRSALPIWLPSGYGVFGAALVHIGLAIARRFDARVRMTIVISEARRTTLRHVAFIAVAGVGTVSVLFRWPAVCAAVIALLLADTIRVWNSRRDLTVAMVGGVCGITLELVATGSGLWWYSHSTFAGLPAWVPVLWPGLLMALPRFADALVDAAQTPLAPPRIALPLGLGIIAAELVLLPALGNTQPVLLTGLFVTLGAAALIIAPSRRSLALLVVAGALGYLCESLPVYLGIWVYPASINAGMPLWLAPGYALFGLGVAHLGHGIDTVVAARHAVARPMVTKKIA